MREDCRKATIQFKNKLKHKKEERKYFLMEIQNKMQ